MVDNHTRMNDRSVIIKRRRRLMAAALACLAPSTSCGHDPAAPASVAKPPPASQSGPPPGTAPPRGASDTTGGRTLETRDSDGDGIADERDACPEVAGVDSEDTSRAGCSPAPCLSIVMPSTIQITVLIHFATGSADVSGKSSKELDDFAQELLRLPELHLAIVGHADATESNDVALLRAKRVHEALVKRGVDRSRLTIESRGKTQPRDSNQTKDGRAKNRRVEFLHRERSDP